MSKTLNKTTGNKGENAAAEMLREKGYRIIARNWRCKWGEVDIVARSGDTTVFVEVKTKTGDDFGEPWEMVNEWKVQQIERMGHLWCEEFSWDGLCRVDVVGVWMEKDGEIKKIEQWENVGA
jgi:putative endonuclease